MPNIGLVLEGWLGQEELAPWLERPGMGPSIWQSLKITPYIFCSLKMCFYDQARPGHFLSLAAGRASRALGEPGSIRDRSY